MPADFLTTIDTDDEVESVGESSRTRRQPKKDEDLDPEFQFDFGGYKSEALDLWGGDEVKGSGSGSGVSDIVIS